jgi:hypothetical protein
VRPRLGGAAAAGEGEREAEREEDRRSSIRHDFFTILSVVRREFKATVRST